MELLFITWDVDPILLHFGDGGVRWYGLLWAIGIMLCYWVQVRLYKHEHCPTDWTDKLFVWMVLGVIIGARVGHCWFYEWHDVTNPALARYCAAMDISTDPVQIFGWTINYRNPYIEHPFKLLKIWEGGLASHGGAIGLIIAAWLLDRRVVRYETKAVWWAQVLKVVLGLGVVMAVRLGAKPVLNRLMGGHMAAGAVRYFLMCLIGCGVWPMTFRYFSLLGHQVK